MPRAVSISAASRIMVELVSYDNEYAPDKARTGATKLIAEDEVKFIMMLGGDTWPAVQPVAERSGMLVSTLLAKRSHAGHRDADRALRGAPDLQCHRCRVAGGEQAGPQDRRDLCPGGQPGTSVGRHLSRRVRGRRHRGDRPDLFRHLDHRLRACDDRDAREQSGHRLPRHRPMPTMSIPCASRRFSRASRAR